MGKDFVYSVVMPLLIPTVRRAKENPSRIRNHCDLRQCFCFLSQPMKRALGFFVWLPPKLQNITNVERQMGKIEADFSVTCDWSQKQTLTHAAELIICKKIGMLGSLCAHVSAYVYIEARGHSLMSFLGNQSLPSCSLRPDLSVVWNSPSWFRLTNRPWRSGLPCQCWDCKHTLPYVFF